MARGCSVADCVGPHYGRGYCRLHWFRWWTHGDVTVNKRILKHPEREKPCSVEGCDRVARSRGMCPFHYQRWQRYGTTEGKRPRHGGSDTPTYKSWSHMIGRCSNPNEDAWEHYGGRGITVCERWSGRDGFLNFLADMGARPDGLTIDRINVNGNYEPSNCRWATRQEQSANQRRHQVPH